MPHRTDQILHVSLTPQQAEPYWEQNDILAGLMRKMGTARLALRDRPDPNTGRKTLSIPLPQSIDADRLTRAIAGVLSAFGRSA